MAAWIAGGTAAGSAVTGAAAAVPVGLGQLGLFFLKVGAVLYGSGYVLIAYIQGGLVHEYGWLTEQELLDAVAIGQITPGPLLSTVTFIGYLVAGAPGAAVATAAVLLPGLCLVAAINPWIARLRQWSWSALFLDAIGAASVGLTAVVTIGLGRAVLTFHDWRGWLVALAAALVLWRTHMTAAWLVLAGALAGAILW
jgi:chromate transporter